MKCCKHLLSGLVARQLANSMLIFLVPAFHCTSYQSVQLWWGQLDKLGQEGISDRSTAKNVDLPCCCQDTLPEGAPRWPSICIGQESRRQLPHAALYSLNVVYQNVTLCEQSQTIRSSPVQGRWRCWNMSQVLLMLLGCQAGSGCKAYSMYKNVHRLSTHVPFNIPSPKSRRARVPEAQAPSSFCHPF